MLRMPLRPSFPGLPPLARFVESLGFRGWFKRKSAKGLRRLRSILEENEQRGTRATVAGI